MRKLAPIPLLLSLLAAQTAALAQAPPPASAPDVDGALAALASASPGQARLDAAAKVIALGPPAVPALIARLGRARTASDGQRRSVLAKIKADMPGKSGNFTQPPAPEGKQKPEPDWLALLAPLEGSDSALVETIEAVVVVRALAAAETEAATDAILDFGFSPDGTAFRDECGRQLRVISPYSLPTLLRASQEKKRNEGAYARYATYEMDRMGKGRPALALAAATDDTLAVAMLVAIGKAKHPDAVTAVLDRTDDPSHAVRKAARDAWMAYITGPPPAPAPREKRKLPGGKMSDVAMPLYLTYRELADEEIRRVLTMLQGAAPDPHADLETLTRTLFDIYDQRRQAAWDATMSDAGKLVGAGKLEEAAKIYDDILVTDPLFAKRPDMVAGYLALGRELAGRSTWDKAVLAFDKAYSIDPTGAHAREAEGQLYYARAQRDLAAGRSADEDLARAAAADPSLGEVKVAVAAQARSQARQQLGWVRWAGIGAGAAAALLLLIVLLWPRGRKAAA